MSIDFSHQHPRLCVARVRVSYNDCASPLKRTSLYPNFFISNTVRRNASASASNGDFIDAIDADPCSIFRPSLVKHQATPAPSCEDIQDASEGVENGVILQISLETRSDAWPYALDQMSVLWIH
ncbi:hypothetical protein AALP_AA7G091900 [Arabis alpina]|uniref:Uncharacterized protein n=1 Tax=Arabis alpina TaxID=50452 RepID=A0A087GGX1_ARAAL|nr:hypothetical protein AALP_AA7G091900 [Arabis alpina]